MIYEFMEIGIYGNFISGLLAVDVFSIFSSLVISIKGKI